MAISDRRPNRAFLRSRKSAFSIPFFSIEQIRSGHPVEKIDFFNGMDGSDCSIEKVFEAHRISHHPRKHTITPYNCSDAGLTATAAAAAVAHNESAWHILFSARQQHVPSSDGSSAYNRRPFCSTAAAAVLAMATLNKLERHNRDDEGDEGSSRQTNTLLAEKARHCLLYTSPSPRD